MRVLIKSCQQVSQIKSILFLIFFNLSVKVNEHSLLPLMLEQFPFLYVSGQTLSKMWKQQIAQIEQLKKDAHGENWSKKKLQDEVS